MALLKKYRMHILVAALISMAALPFLMLAFFAFPSADDYGNSLLLSSDLSALFSWKIVASIVSSIINNGYAPISLLTLMFSPMRYFGITGMRVVIFLMNAMFLFSCFVFIKWVLKGIFKDQSRLHWMIAYFLYILCFIGFRFHAEIFSWVTCSMGYLLPINCLHLGLAYFIKGSQSLKKRHWLLCGVFGVVAAMGSTNLAALACGLYITAFLLLIINEKYRKGALIAALAVLAMGVAGLLTPGIYARHDSVTAHYDWLAALSLTMESLGEWEAYLLNSPIALILALAAILAYQWLPSFEKLRWTNLAVVVPVAALGPILVLFPLFFGYGTRYYPARVRFVAELTLILGMLGVIVCVCAFVKSRVKTTPLTRKNIAPLLIVLALLCANIATTYNPREFLPLKIAHDVADGKFMRTYQYWTDTLASWENSEGQDVLVIEESQKGYQLPYYVYPALYVDTTHWLNQDAARYYKMNSILVLPYADYVKEK